MIPWYLKHEKYGVIPWHVQTEALKLSEGQQRYAYYLEQGLGKTALTLNDFLHYFKRYKVNLMLVICPNSFKLDWKNAAKEWGLNLKSGMWPSDRAEKCSIYAMNYEAIRTDAGEKYLNQLTRTRKIFLVFDESSKLGGPKTQQTKKAIQFSRSKGIEFVRCLDGTPRTSSVVNYYGPLKTLNQLNGLTSVGFRNRFCTTGGYMGKAIVGEKNTDQLAAILAKCSFRALKKDWRADLPPRIFKILPVGMTKKQYQCYKEMKEEFSTIIRFERITANLVLTQLAKLRQISSCLLLDTGEAFRIEKPENSPKIKAMLEILEGHKAKTIIVYYYKETGKMIAEILDKKAIIYAPLHGNMHLEDVKSFKKNFNDTDYCNVMLCQQNAACLGHTLIGNENKRATRMIFMENSFSLRDRLQMLDRNHRGDMDETCLVYDLVSSDIERKIINGLNKNKQAADMLDDLVVSLQQPEDILAEAID
jgi:Mesyanzhinovviridae DNA helicase